MNQTENTSVPWSVQWVRACPFVQEYKWRELEEQRQAQELQRQLQKEQAYLLSLQNQNSPSNSPDLHRVQSSQSPAPETVKPVSERSSQSPSQENTTDPLLRMAPCSEPVREVTTLAGTHWPLLVWTHLVHGGGCCGLWRHSEKQYEQYERS